MTNSLSLRVAQHKEKAVPSFTERYNVTRLVHYEMYERVHDAIRREKQIKGWARAKKIALIEQDNPNWEELDPR
jgi:putative endonuclease